MHRIGRTARAGENGRAISIVGHADRDNFRQVLRNYTFDIAEEPVPQMPFVPMQRPKGGQGRGAQTRGGTWRKGSGSNRGGSFRQRKEGGSDDRRSPKRRSAQRGWGR